MQHHALVAMLHLHRATDGKGYTTDGKGCATDGKGYAADGKGYAADGKGYAADGKGYAADGKGYIADGKGYAARVRLRQSCHEWTRTSPPDIFACRIGHRGNIPMLPASDWSIAGIYPGAAVLSCLLLIFTYFLTCLTMLVVAKVCETSLANMFCIFGSVGPRVRKGDGSCTQEAWVYSRDGPIRHRKHGYMPVMDQSDAGSMGIFP
eukprot:9470284-Pyramimonas_sp.AAC.1